MGKVNKRLLILRKELKLSQKAFGEKLGVDGSSVSNMETGRFNITDTMIKLIGSTFNVSEDWLRTGEGGMFNRDPDKELAYMLGRFAAEEGSFRHEFISRMMKLDDDQWALVESFIRQVCRED